MQYKIASRAALAVYSTNIAIYFMYSYSVPPVYIAPLSLHVPSAPSAPSELLVQVEDELLAQKK